MTPPIHVGLTQHPKKVTEGVVSHITKKLFFFLYGSFYKIPHFRSLAHFVFATHNKFIINMYTLTLLYNDIILNCCNLLQIRNK